MHFAVNTQVLVSNRLEGLGWFTYESLKRMVINHPEHQFTFIFSQPYSADFLFADNVKAVVINTKYNHPATWFVRFELALPWVLRRLKPDVYFSPDGWCSLLTGVKTVAVIHDLNFEHSPKSLPWTYRTYYRWFFPRWAKKAKRLATVSEFSKQDIVSTYGINPSKIDVVYNGANESLHAISDDQKTETRRKYTNGSKYFVFVGATPLRKNLINLFKAFDLFKQTDENSYKLVLVGAKKWWAESIKEAYESMQFKNDVIFTGRVSTDDLNNLLAASEAMTYVSLFEGFGIPLLEAMWCETAIITSNCTSMPEIAADAALFVDPYSPQTIADAMHTIVKNPQLRTNLIENGKKRRVDFSWEITAQRMWNCLEKASK